MVRNWTPIFFWSVWQFGEAYVSVEDLEVRIMHVDPDRLLFMFDERILIFLKSDSFYLPSVKTPKMAANPLKKTEIRCYTTEDPAFRPLFQRYGWTLCLSRSIKRPKHFVIRHVMSTHNLYFLWNIQKAFQQFDVELRHYSNAIHLYLIGFAC